MNKEDHVSFEVAELLKGKGYNAPCLAYYMGRKLIYVTSSFRGSDLEALYEESYSQVYGNIPAPTLYEADKWIWQNHKLLVNAFLKSPFGQPYEFMFYIQDAKNTLDDYGIKVSDKSFDTYEEALNTGILEALKLI